MSSYEVWLCDDAGRRLHLFPEFQYLSMARLVQGYGYIEMGIPFDAYVKAIPTVFQVDWRLDVWRSPMPGIQARREGSFFLRKFNIYDRQEDRMRFIKLYGRSPLDILRRQFIAETEDTTFTDYADDMMKQLVTDYLLGAPAGYTTAPSGEVTVDSDLSNAPSISQTFSLNNLLDALKKIQAAVSALNKSAPDTYPNLYFDMVENSSLVTNGFGYTFRTWTGLRGGDRTNGILFSVENGNLKEPSYYEDYNDEVTSQNVYNKDTPSADATADSPDATLSRWNMARSALTSSDTDANANLGKARSALSDSAAVKKLSCTFLDTPGGPTQPRSLYGVDWDLGDLLPVKYGNQLIDAEVRVVYLSLSANGTEKITGLNTVGE